jgi:hypothetical protein
MTQKPTYKGFRKTNYMDPQQVYVGDPIRSAVTMSGRNNLQWMRTWGQSQMLAMYNGGTEDSNNYPPASDFYIIYDMPAWNNNGGTNDYRYVSGRMWHYDFDVTPFGGAQNRDDDWYPDASTPGTVFNDTMGAYSYASTTDHTRGNFPTNAINMPILPVISGGGFKAAVYHMNWYKVAALSMWTMPDQFISQNDYGDILYDMERYKFLPGSLCKGRDDTSGSYGALARMLERTGTGASSASPDVGVHSSRRVLFQNTFPIGIYLEDTTSFKYARYWTHTGSDRPFKWKIRRSNLRDGTTDNKVLPAFVVTTTGNTGGQVKFTSTATTNTWTWTESTTRSGDLIIFSDGSPNTGLTCDPDEDEITIEFKTGSATSTMTLHTLACFENRYVL